MKEIVFNKKDYESYKDFYHDVCIKLNKEQFIDWQGVYEDLGYRADFLEEFLFYCTMVDTYHFKFVGFNTKEIKAQQSENFKSQKDLENYKYKLIFEVFEKFVKDYPNNKLEFIEEK